MSFTLVRSWCPSQSVRQDFVGYSSHLMPSISKTFQFADMFQRQERRHFYCNDWIIHFLGDGHFASKPFWGAPSANVSKFNTFFILVAAFWLTLIEFISNSALNMSLPAIVLAGKQFRIRFLPIFSINPKLLNPVDASSSKVVGES